MKIAYWGPYPSGVLGGHDGGRSYRWRRGEDLEVPAELGRKVLAEHPHFRPVPGDQAAEAAAAEIAAEREAKGKSEAGEKPAAFSPPKRRGGKGA